MDDVTLISQIVDYAYVILIPLVAYGVKLLKVFLEEKIGVEVQSGFKDEIIDALQFGKRKAKQSLGDKADQIQFDNETVQNAVAYLFKHAPKWIKMLGFTEETIKEMVESYLEGSKAND